MGLDMYLYKKTYVQNWSYQSKDDTHTITVKKGGKVRKDIKPERVSEITEHVGQWRKFNALHSWFINNFADGVDDCRMIYVGEDGLKQALEVLQKVKAALDKAGKKVASIHVGWKDGEKMYEDMEVYDADEVEKLLPTASGFFFGGTEYDEYYYDEVCRTIELFEELLKEESDGDYYYEASW